jgi:hypothetical protein
MKMNNKARFWTGVGLFGSEALAGIIYAMTLIHWNWVTERVLLITLSALAFLLYNGLAIILLWNGSKEKQNGKK